MPSAVVSTAIVAIAGIVMASIFAVALLSQVGVIDSTFRGVSQNAINKMKTSIDIVYLTLNGSYFVVYVKNTGQRSISVDEIELIDVYFGNDSMQLYVYNTTGLGIWNYTEVSPDNTWSVGETLIIRIYNETAIEGPTYYVKIVLPNGVSDEDTYTI